MTSESNTLHILINVYRIIHDLSFGPGGDIKDKVYAKELWFRRAFHCKRVGFKECGYFLERSTNGYC